MVRKNVLSKLFPPKERAPPRKLLAPLEPERLVEVITTPLIRAVSVFNIAVEVVWAVLFVPRLTID